MYEFLVTDDFRDSLKKLDSQVQRDIKNKLKFLASTENPLLFSKKLKGYKNIFRFRCGDFRIVFQLKGKTILLLLVKHRKEIYEGF